MVIDLQRCIGCYSCQISCKMEHFLPPNIFWNRVLIGEKGKYPSVTKIIMPTICNHCTDAACVEVCPTGATQIRDDGIVHIDYDQCVGCRSCLIACPYQQRSYHSNEQEAYFPGQGPTEMEAMGKELFPLQKGTVVKCTFCSERIDEGIEKGLKPGVDREATPACVIACPANARYFGDLNDPESDVSRLIREKKAAPFHPEFETSPNVFYILR